jgi:hypothetical protein
LNERDKMAISVGFDQLGIVLAEAEIARRRHQQHLAIQRINELKMEKQEEEMREQIRRMGRTLDMGVIEALQNVLIACPPDHVAHESPTQIEMSGTCYRFKCTAFVDFSSFFHIEEWVTRMLSVGS